MGHSAQPLHTPPAPDPAGPERVEVHPEEDAPLRSSLFGARRRFLVDRRLQLRAAFLAVSVALALVVLLNLSLHAFRSRESRSLLSNAPEFATVVQAQDRLEAGLAALASFVFLVGVFVVTVLETHKTAGAAYNLGHRLRDVSEGRYGSRLRLRHGDNLRELVGPFNEMCRALQERAWRDAEALDRLAEEATRVGSPVDAEALADRLRRAADEQRRLADDA